MSLFTAEKVFEDLERRLQELDNHDISFEDGETEKEKVFAIGYVRRGKLEMIDDNGKNIIQVSFDFDLKHDDERYNKFIETFIKLTKAR